MQDLDTQWIQSYPCKTKSSHETEIFSKKILGTVARTESCLFRQTRWNLEKHVKVYHGITALQHLIDPRQMGSLREPFDESKKAHQKYCYSQDWLKGGGLTLWNAAAICGTSKTSWPTGSRHMKDELENHSKDQSYLLEQWLNVILLYQKIRKELCKNVLPGIFLGYELITEEIWKRNIL